MGVDACNFLKNFTPDGYESIPNVGVDDEVFHMCLQGANLGKALKTWLDSLKWPANVAEKGRHRLGHVLV